MAPSSFEEETPYFPSVMDRNSNIPVSCSCFQCFAYFNRGDFISSERKASFHNSHVQDVYDISMLPEEVNTSAQCASQLTVLGFVEVPFPSKRQMCLEAQLDCQNCIDLQMKSADAYSSCIVDINVDKEIPETLKTNDEVVGSIKSEGMVTKIFCFPLYLIIVPRWIAAYAKGVAETSKLEYRFAPPCGFASHSHYRYSTNMFVFWPTGFVLTDKSLTERIHDAPINRWRRYRRAASFDSRKVVILFSVLSSLGTLVLIYLTLRVRQNGDSFSHI
ncbi:hypothetical protein JRO89_XS08G0006200 [Xanthoceras sorbifolium]|uniref:Uncharacterized protein n=1 Tax=Xanthoceras sorbifolium TaxID=99658 RepID=A0ABQ8HMZ8_9ROSI|nr:hypothetical protein JRO89_XS08G0006200 [Xanthoceras sorbifolium]